MKVEAMQCTSSYLFTVTLLLCNDSLVLAKRVPALTSEEAPFFSVEDESCYWMDKQETLNITLSF